jgi:hypothetical protein
VGGLAVSMMEWELSRDELKKDKNLQKILKSVNKIKALSPSERYQKYEELIRYILAIMIDKKHDTLIQTTSLWSLLNLLQLDYDFNIQIMLRVGVPSVLHEILKHDTQPVHTKAYASQLISALW